MAQENKNTVQNENEQEAILWKPTYKWLAKVAGIIVVCIIVLFFALNVILRPYMRKIPIEITPWLNHGNTSSSVQQ